MLDKLFWVAVPPALVRIETIADCSYTRDCSPAGFRLYWRLISKARSHVGRRQTSREVRELIFRMVLENPTWGVPRIHGELPMLGFDVSERTISRWMKRAPRDPCLVPIVPSSAILGLQRFYVTP